MAKPLDRSGRAITLRDVAQAANVSTAVVSKVLNGGDTNARVSPEKAAHIRMIAGRMNYRVNALARNLRTSRTRTIGVFFENLHGISDGPLYTVNLLDGVAAVLFRNKYRLTILAEIDHNDVIGSLGDGQLDGVIWCKLARDEETADLIRQTPVPIVAFNAANPAPDTATLHINCDNQGGIELALEHLWELGHRQIAFLHEWEERNTPDCVARREAYEKFLKARGAKPIVLACSWDLEGVVESLRESGATAVVGWTERVAGHLLQELHAHSISVPEEMSVVGFDSTLYCETTTPRLTAVRQPIAEMAAFAAQSLIDLLAGKQPESLTTVFPCTLDVRGSTAPISTQRHTSQ